MQILVVDCGSTKVPKIHEVLQALGHRTIAITLAELHSIGELLADAIVISGAPILVTEIDYQDHLVAMGKLLAADKPLLGICFGHQLLGLYHGAEAFRCPEDRSWTEIEIKVSHPLFTDLPRPKVNFTEDHCEAISLPSGFFRLASSKICENEVMAHASKPWYGVQFHPETAEQNGITLLTNFCRIAASA